MHFKTMLGFNFKINALSLDLDVPKSIVFEGKETLSFQRSQIPKIFRRNDFTLILALHR